MLLGGKVRDKLAKEKDFGILMMMREKVGFIENTARRHRWGG